MASRKAHPAELRERAVAMVFELRAETGNVRGSIARVGHRLGINTETLRNWVQKGSQPPAQASHFPESSRGSRVRTVTGDRDNTLQMLKSTSDQIAYYLRLPRLTGSL